MTYFPEIFTQSISCEQSTHLPLSDFPLIHSFVLYFCSNGVSCSGAFHLAEVLKRNPTLDIVDLSFNRLEDEGAVYLSKVLSSAGCGLRA